MRCPSCDSRNVGRVGADYYYCWDCCVEYALGSGAPQIFQVDVNGDLAALTPTGGEAGDGTELVPGAGTLTGA